MDAFFEWPWRFYPATVIAIAGVVLAVRGLRRQAVARRYSEATMSKPVYMMSGFRLILLGVPLVLASAGWVLQQEWLFWIGVIVAGEETLETSMLLAALHEGERAQAHAARRRARVRKPAAT
jgi:hypothetical protein